MRAWISISASSEFLTNLHHTCEACDETETNSREAEADLQDSGRHDWERTCELGRPWRHDDTNTLGGGIVGVAKRHWEVLPAQATIAGDGSYGVRRRRRRRWRTRRGDDGFP